MTETSAAERARALLELAGRAAAAYERPDLAERIRAQQRRVDNPTVRVLVVGEFKQGKSSIVNALLGLEVCPVDDDVATAVPTVVHWAADLAAVAVRRGPDGQIEREAFEVSALPEIVTEARADADDSLLVVEIGLPATLLEDGLLLIDTPGVGGIGSLHSAHTVAMLPVADAVLFVTDASSELTVPEVTFLRTVVALCPRVLVVTTKIDLHPEWRKIHELDGIHLVDAGFDVEQAAVSAALREMAIESGDKAVNDESRFPDLVRWLRDTVVRAAAARDIAAVVEVVDHVAAQLHAQLAAERTAIDDPETAAALVASLERTQVEAEHVRRAGSRWQQVMSDGFSDANAAIDLDLRTRLRELTSEADAAVDEVDPAVGWAEFEPWLYQKVADSVGQHLVVRHDRLALWIGDVAATFGDDEAAAHLFDTPDAGTVLAGAGREAHLEVTRMRIGSQVYSLVRNSYSGIAMFGALAGIAGLILSAPAAVGVGLLIGGKGLREEKVRQLAQRRAQGKVSVRQYLDALAFTLNNDERETMRVVQRAVRDHFSERATELHRTAAAALDAARRAKDSSDATRAERSAYLDAELAKVQVVIDRASRLRDEVIVR